MSDNSIALTETQQLVLTELRNAVVRLYWQDPAFRRRVADDNGGLRLKPETIRRWVAEAAGEAEYQSWFHADAR